MKLTKLVIKQFEAEQKSFGTDIALYNILWSVANEILADLGVQHTSTSHKPKKR